MKNLFVSCMSHNSWNEGSLKIEISKTRDPSKWKFPKRGIAQADGQQMALIAAVWKVIYSPIFDFTLQTLKFFYAEVYTFPRFGIFELSDPSFWKFPFWGIPHFKNSGMHETNSSFFGGFTQFCVPVFAARQSLCTWHRYFEKTSVLACFFWLQGPLMQSSAAPQGSPPPTQQIKIQMQISWVGWSTRVRCASGNVYLLSWQWWHLLTYKEKRHSRVIC